MYSYTDLSASTQNLRKKTKKKKTNPKNTKTKHQRWNHVKCLTTQSNFGLLPMIERSFSKYRGDTHGLNLKKNKTAHTQKKKKIGNTD